jgi:hypothetical protein
MRTKHLAILFAFIAWTSAFGAAILARAKEAEFGAVFICTAIVALVAMIVTAIAHVDGTDKDDVWAQRLAEERAKTKAAEKDRDEWVERCVVERAEAKLAKVRAWVAKHDEGADALMYDTAPDYGELLAILDEDP